VDTREGSSTLFRVDGVREHRLPSRKGDVGEGLDCHANQEMLPSCSKVVSERCQRCNEPSQNDQLLPSHPIGKVAHRSLERYADEALNEAEEAYEGEGSAEVEGVEGPEGRCQEENTLTYGLGKGLDKGVSSHSQIIFLRCQLGFIFHLFKILLKYSSAIF